MAGGSTLVPVIWTNLADIDVLYVSNGMAIDSWPSSFRRAFWLSLAAEIGTSLGVSGASISAIAQEADRAIAQACQADQRVEVVTTDYIPDWMQVRFNAPFGSGIPTFDPAIQPASGPTAFIVGDVGANSPLPAYLSPASSLNGVVAVGLETRDLGDGCNQYIPASTPDSRIGILTIGVSPVAWRRPYHNMITLGQNPGDGESEA